MKKAIRTVCVAGGALFGLYTIFYASMAVGIGYGLTSDKDGWSMVTTSAEAVKDFDKTHNITRLLVHIGELAGIKNAEEYLKR